MMKPCPFCGGDDIRWSAVRGGYGHRFTCMKCHANGPLGEPLKGKDAQETSRLRTDDAERLWNTRVSE